METVAVAAAAAAALLVLGSAACAAQPAPPAQPTVVAPAANETNAEPAGSGPAPFGQRRSVSDGLVIEVSNPRSITPSDTAYPASKRAVAFEITIDNQGGDVYRTDTLDVTATANGHTARQVVDTTQGYTGTSGIPQLLPPGKSVHVTIAFAVPAEQVAMELSVQPLDSVDGTADFAGRA